MTNNPQAPEGPSTLSYAIGLAILGTSAGFTLYTRKTGGMLRAMEQVEKNQLRRKPPKVGPVTKTEYEKMKPRIDKDDLF